jgi:integrase
VLAMTYLGLRWSELAALRVADVDLVRRRVHVVERATEVGGRVDVAAPKSRASNRYVAVPGLLLPMLGARIEGRAADADLRWIQKAMGHESITTTARIYAHLYDDELDSVVAALERIARGD